MSKLGLRVAQEPGHCWLGLEIRYGHTCLKHMLSFQHRKAWYQLTVDCSGPDETANVASQTSSLDDIILAARARRASGAHTLSTPAPRLAKSTTAKATQNTKAGGLNRKKPAASDNAAAATDAEPNAQPSADLAQTISPAEDRRPALGEHAVYAPLHASAKHHALAADTVAL